MQNGISALDQLRKSTKVDIDSLDLRVAQKYGPFVDCTSNQAIAWFELQKPDHRELVQQSVQKAVELKEHFIGVRPHELATEIATISLALRIVPHLSACIHIQANTLHTTSNETVADAQRLKTITQLLDPTFDISRLCIKIPSTWEGLKACKTLENEHGIKTLATTLFGLPQVLLAGEVGCHYIAPYLHSLPDVMSNTLRTDRNSTAELDRTLHLIRTAQIYYSQRKAHTQILPAALMSARECRGLAGVHHMTLAPARIEELSGMWAAEHPAESLFPPKMSGDILMQVPEMKEVAGRLSVDEKEWREALEGEDAGVPKRKTDEAIGVFNDMQRKLEDMMAALF